MPAAVWRETWSGNVAPVLEQCVGDVDAFAADHWGRAPLLRRGAGDFRDLLDPRLRR